MYCPHCRGHVSSHIESKCEDLNVKGLTVKVDERVRVCDGCGKELFDRELEKEIEKAAFEAYEKAAFEVYRQQKGLLRYHVNCPHCKYIWWSQNPFPKKCKKCGKSIP